MSHRNSQLPSSQLPRSQFPDLEVGESELETGRCVYVYALVDQAGRTTTIGGRRIEIVEAGRVFAAVDAVRGPRPQLSEAALREQHTIVVALARRFDAVLPARFGAWLAVQVLEHMLTTNGARIRRAFSQVRNREQFSVRFFGEREQIPAGSSSGTAYLRSRLTASRPELSEAARLIRRALKPIVRAERIESGRGGVRITIHHLVDRGRAREYRSVIRRTLRGSPGERVVVTGPWPPFAFAPDLLP
jgi:hypothetical protein